MKILILILMVVSLTGCTTISNISKLNRIYPQIENMIELKNARDMNPNMLIKTTQICGKDQTELHVLQAYANQLGWEVYNDGGSSNCLGISYDGVDK